MNKFSKYNKGYKYLLTIIDVFSKYGWIVPIQNKSGYSVAKALEGIFKRSGRTPSRLWTDKGKEFYNEKMKQLLKNMILSFILLKMKKSPRSLKDGIVP